MKIPKIDLFLDGVVFESTGICKVFLKDSTGKKVKGLSRFTGNSRISGLLYALRCAVREFCNLEASFSVSKPELSMLGKETEKGVFQFSLIAHIHSAGMLYDGHGKGDDFWHVMAEALLSAVIGAAQVALKERPPRRVEIAAD